VRARENEENKISLLTTYDTGSFYINYLHKKSLKTSHFHSQRVSRKRKEREKKKKEKECVCVMEWTSSQLAILETHSSLLPLSPPSLTLLINKLQVFFSLFSLSLSFIPPSPLFFSFLSLSSPSLSLLSLSLSPSQ